MDTSGSMWGYNTAACSAMTQVVNDLSAAGITVNSRLWGISDTYGSPCLNGNVRDQLGNSAGDGTCPIIYSYSESWATASAVVAEKFAWTPGALRIVVPLSDECPCYRDGCDSSDLNAILNAITVANEKDVCVAPLIAGNSVPVWNYAVQLATGTGCQAFKIGSSG
jgi:hypothetical protein